MFKRKLKRIEKIILIGFITSSITFVGMWLMNKKPDRDFFIPKGYEGWVRVEYQVEGGDELPLKEGVQQIIANDTGYVATSTRLEVGWRKDRYFWLNPDGSTEEIPPYVALADEDYGIYLHGHAYYSKSYEDILKSLPAGTDTTFADETRIIMEPGNRVDYTKGRKVFEYFFISREPESIAFNPPAIPHTDVLTSTEDRSVPGN